MFATPLGSHGSVGSVMMREAIVIPRIVCPQCGGELSLDETDCPACASARTFPPSPSPAPNKQPARPRRAIEDDPWLMVVLLLFGIGPLALPMLWRGGAFSIVGKLFLTALVFGLMALIAGLLWYVCVYQLAPLADPNLWRS